MKRLFQVSGGEAAWPPPVRLMRQSGRNLPKYRAVRESVAKLGELRTNLELAAEATPQPVRHAEREPLLRAMGGRPFIFDLEHGVVLQTLLEHVRGS